MAQVTMIAALSVALALLSGCKTLENRITTTLTGDRAYMQSHWGPVTIGTELSAEDAAELRRMMGRQLGQK